MMSGLLDAIANESFGKRLLIGCRTDRGFVAGIDGIGAPGPGGWGIRRFIVRKRETGEFAAGGLEIVVSELIAPAAASDSQFLGAAEDHFFSNCAERTGMNEEFA